MGICKLGGKSRIFSPPIKTDTGSTFSGLFLNSYFVPRTLREYEHDDENEDEDENERTIIDIMCSCS